MIKFLSCVGLIVAGAVYTDKKLNLQVTVPQAQLIMQALSECDCPQKSTAELKQYIATEYNLQFPQPKPKTPKDSTTKP